MPGLSTLRNLAALARLRKMRQAAGGIESLGALARGKTAGGLATGLGEHGLDAAVRSRRLAERAGLETLGTRASLKVAPVSRIGTLAEQAERTGGGPLRAPLAAGRGAFTARGPVRLPGVPNGRLKPLPTGLGALRAGAQFAYRHPQALGRAGGRFLQKNRVPLAAGLGVGLSAGSLSRRRRDY